MKKVYLTALCASVLFASCDLDVNTDPNYPDSENITADLLFPSAQNYIAASSCDVMFNYAGFYAQYYDQMPNANQFNEIANQSTVESDNLIGYAYRNLFAGALTDLEDIKTKTTNTADLLAVAAMRVFAFQLLVDNMSECPYTEALQGGTIPSPSWDSAETVYTGIIAELEDAIAAYEANPENMVMADMMFGSDTDQWVGYANALLLRLYMRIYDVDSSVESKIKALVAANDFFTGDATLDIYSDAENNRSPFYASYFSLGTKNHCASYPIITYMKATNDPRIAYQFNVAVNTEEYVGQMPGAKADQKDWTSSLTWVDNDVSNVNYALYDGSGASRPGYLYTQANLQFLIAEVEYRFNNDAAAAKAAYEAAITADFSARGMSADAATFMAGSEVAWDSASDKLELIYLQKWAALCYMDNMEAWSEIRRTDVPSLSAYTGDAIYADPTIYTPGTLIEPYRNGLGSGVIVKRVNYSYYARMYNQNTPTAISIDTKVWWDVK